MALLHTPLADSKFAFNALQFIGLIGGQQALFVMAMIPAYRGRRWLGWYNNPGSLDIARRLIDLNTSFKKLPYVERPSAALFGLDNATGPEFVSAFSGTNVQTGHLGYLILQRIKEIASKVHQIEGMSIDPVVVNLLEVDPRMIDLEQPLLLSEPHITHTLLALIPITTSIITCLLCCFVSDWHMFSVILAGIFTSGFASMVIGSAKLVLQGPSPTQSAEGAPPGNCMAISEGTVIVVRGSDQAMNVITRGRFQLQGGGFWQIMIQYCAVFYLAEAIAQFFLIPHGTLFGQIMFLVSLCVSKLYSNYLVMYKKGRLQAEVLFKKLEEPRVQKFLVGSRTTMAVFVCLLLFHDTHHLASPPLYYRILMTALPNDTVVWRRWQEKVANQLQSKNDESLRYLEFDEQDRVMNESDQRLLLVLLRHAVDAFRGYFGIRGSLSGVSVKNRERSY